MAGVHVRLLIIVNIPVDRESFKTETEIFDVI